MEVDVFDVYLDFEELEVGEFYIDGYGDPHQITEELEGPYPFIDNFGNSYTRDGYSRGDGRPTFEDLTRHIVINTRVKRC